jgi:hypothetical protein
MNYLMNKLKLVATGVVAIAFLMAVSLSSCGTKSTDNGEGTETVQDEEHPAAEQTTEMDSTMHEEEHPAGEEEHPSDSSEASGEEHPTDK